MLVVRILLLVFLLFIQLNLSASAQTAGLLQEEINTLKQSVSEAQELLTGVQERLHALQMYHAEQQVEIAHRDTTRLLQQAQQSIHIAKADTRSLGLMIAIEQQTTQNLTEDIHSFETNKENGTVKPETALLHLKYQKLALQKERNDLLDKTLTFMTAIINEQENWGRILQKAQVAQLESTRQEKRNKEITQVQSELNAVQQQLSKWQSALLNGIAINTSENDWIEKQVLLLEEKRQYYFTELAIIQLEPLIDTLQTVLMQMDSGLFALRKANEQASFLLNELKSSGELINDKLVALEQQQITIEDNYTQHHMSYADYTQLKNTTTQLMADYNALMTRIEVNTERVVSYRTTISQTYGVGLTAHEPLPSNLEQWRVLYKEMIATPSLLTQKIKQDWHRMVLNLSQASVTALSLLMIIELVWLLLCIITWRAVNNTLIATEASKKSFAGHLWLTFTNVLAHNRLSHFGFYLIIAFVLSAIFSGETDNIVVDLTLVWLVYKIAMGIAQFTLITRQENVNESDMRLYKTLRWSFIISASFAAITVTAHQLTLSPEVTGFIDRLFMLILCFICYPLLRVRDIIPEIIAPYIGTHNYLKRTAQVVASLIPITILASAAIGLIGYINLAWQIATIAGKCIIIVGLWLLLRGLLRDAMTLLAEICIKQLKNGWLWTEALLKPLQHVLHIILIGVMIFLLTNWITNEREPSPFLFKLQQAIFYPLINIGDTAITSVTLIQFFLVLMVVLWAGRWSREFSYRWLFTRFQDPGVRNSLSVFTQYGVLTIGGLVILNVLGIDLTTLAVVAGALAVGIGFGVRDIANNLLCGLLLLIERPVRQGDLIKVGDFEGKVIDIGMRAITIKNGDNLEVLIPNAFIINQSVINSTRSENALRTSFNLKIGFHDDLNRVKELIHQMIEEHPSVLDKPTIQITIKDVGDSAIILHIHYYTAPIYQDTRDMIKSDILGKLLAALKEAGIELPYPHQDIRFHKES